MKPAKRKVVTRSPSHTVRLLHLPHVQEQPVEADSSLERDFVQIAGLYPFIKSIKHQPFRLELRDGKSYTPDFLLDFVDGSRLVVEIKPQEFVAQHQQKLQAAEALLAQARFGFLIATDEMLRAGALAARALRIRRYSKGNFSKEITDQLVSYVEAHPAGVSLEETCRQSGLTTEMIFHALAYHRICTRNPLDIRPEAVLIDVQIFRLEVANANQSHAVHFAGWLDSSRRGNND